MLGTSQLALPLSAGLQGRRTRPIRRVELSMHHTHNFWSRTPTRELAAGSFCPAHMREGYLSYVRYYINSSRFTLDLRSSQFLSFSSHTIFHLDATQWVLTIERVDFVGRQRVHGATIPMGDTSFRITYRCTGISLRCDLFFHHIIFSELSFHHHTPGCSGIVVHTWYNQPNFLEHHPTRTGGAAIRARYIVQLVIGTARHFLRVQFSLFLRTTSSVTGHNYVPFTELIWHSHLSKQASTSSEPIALENPSFSYFALLLLSKIAWVL